LEIEYWEIEILRRSGMPMDWPAGRNASMFDGSFLLLSIDGVDCSLLGLYGACLQSDGCDSCAIGRFRNTASRLPDFKLLARMALA
jgi:hypothetical protein